MHPAPGATTWCDVIPAALSTSRTPSCCAGLLHRLVSRFSSLLPAMSRARVPRRRGRHTTPNWAQIAQTSTAFFERKMLTLFIGQFFEENCHDHATSSPQMIDEPFVFCFRNHAEGEGSGVAQTKAQFFRRTQIASVPNSSRINSMRRRGKFSDWLIGPTSTPQRTSSRRDLERLRPARCIRVLKRTRYE